MTAPRGGGRPSTGGGGASARGLILIAVAVLLGVGLLSKGFDGGGATPANVGSKASGATTTTSSTPAGGDAGGTTGGASAAHPPAAVSVMVLNGIGQSGLAGKTVDALKAASFTSAEAGDVTGDPKVATSAIYFQPSYDADAAAIAAALKLPATGVAAMPATPPTYLPADKIASAHVVVVVGSDSPLAQAG